MGVSMSSVRSCFHKRETRLVMVGLDAAGKTTILLQLKTGQVVATVPTAGLNFERIDHRSLRMSFYDIGGSEKMRKLWRHHLAGAQGLIFVVDSSDRDRAEAAGEELHGLLQHDELRDASVLVYANKQDLPNALSMAELTIKLGMHDLQDRRWLVQPACAITGKGLYEGLDWLSSAIQRRS